MCFYPQTLLLLHLSLAASITPLGYTAPDLTAFSSSRHPSPDTILQECPLGISTAAPGVCTTNASLPFCGAVINYTSVCVPVRPGWTALAKDAELQTQFNAAIAAREAAEAAATAGDNFTVIRFSQNPDCVNAFKSALCWANFPQCGAPLVCPAACTNYFQACRFAEANCYPSWPFPPAPTGSYNCTGAAGRSGFSLVFLFLIYLVS